MSQSERVREVTRTARVISGILCTALGGGLLLWLCCWILWVTSGRGIGALFSGPFVTISTLVQLCVAILFAVAGVLFLVDSSHARRCLHIASVGLLLEIPVVLAAILFEIVSVV